jgi:hypothetical protein
MHEELEPLSFEMKLKGCPYRDSREIRIFLLAQDLYSELSDLDQQIRARLKHHEGVGEDEANFLEELRRSMETLHMIEC